MIDKSKKCIALCSLDGFYWPIVVIERFEYKEETCSKLKECQLYYMLNWHIIYILFIHYKPFIIIIMISKTMPCKQLVQQKIRPYNVEQLLSNLPHQQMFHGDVVVVSVASVVDIFLLSPIIKLSMRPVSFLVLLLFLVLLGHGCRCCCFGQTLVVVAVVLPLQTCLS